ncbi:MAG: putative metal-binding motif-containing protein [Candidatus Nanoarchaeia archaeon]|nr:putative metal-binding motif-containing protein [Candidatus Nanoarchaeia archaeon]
MKIIKILTVFVIFAFFSLFVNAVAVPTVQELCDSTKGTYSFETYIRGDCNGDGFIGTPDNVIVNLVKSKSIRCTYSNGTERFDYVNVFDFNGDGFIGLPDINEFEKLYDGEIPQKTYIMDNCVCDYGNWDAINGCLLDSDADGFYTDLDCNDNDATIYPGATEICDNKANDCNDLTKIDGSEEIASDNTNQLGVCLGSKKICSLGAWTDSYVSIIGYEAVEVTCDTKDNDCDGLTDENLLTIFYEDLDLDGDGNALVNVTSCAIPLAYVLTGTDCNDTDVLINKAAAEIIDNDIDENCDGIKAYSAPGTGGSNGGGGGGGGSSSHRRPAVVVANPQPVNEPIVQENQNNPVENTQDNQVTGAVTAETGNGNLYVILGIIGVLGILGLFIWKKYY